MRGVHCVAFVLTVQRQPRGELLDQLPDPEVLGRQHLLTPGELRLRKVRDEQAKILEERLAVHPRIRRAVLSVRPDRQREEIVDRKTSLQVPADLAAPNVDESVPLG